MARADAVSGLLWHRRSAVSRRQLLHGQGMRNDMHTQAHQNVSAGADTLSRSLHATVRDNRFAQKSKALRRPQAARSVDVASWAAAGASSNRIDLSKEHANEAPSTWAGHVACDGRRTDIRSLARLPAPSHATLLSTTPKLVPLPAQRSVDPRLATSAAPALNQQRCAGGRLGPGTYQAAASDFGEERGYKRVVRPQCGGASGVPWGASRGTIAIELVKRCAVREALHCCWLLADRSPPDGNPSYRCGSAAIAVGRCLCLNSWDRPCVAAYQLARSIEDGVVKHRYTKEEYKPVSRCSRDERYLFLQPVYADAANAPGTSCVSRGNLHRKLPSGVIMRGVVAGQAAPGQSPYQAVSGVCRFGARSAGRATMLTDSTALRRW